MGIIIYKLYFHIESGNAYEEDTGRRVWLSIQGKTTEQVWGENTELKVVYQVQVWYQTVVLVI